MKLIAFLLCFLMSSTAAATTSLFFTGDGYSIYMEIGHDEKPGVASLSVRTPDTAQRIVLRRNFEVLEFDVPRRRLLIRFVKQEPGQPDSFTLDVEGERAKLTTGGKEIISDFSWFM
ncbi:MAG: hypothetical protein R3212_10900 [Xanthomonadales bacterium]|nr:hypothetical protein [Xanthomonadales bacterium]